MSLWGKIKHGIKKAADTVGDAASQAASTVSDAAQTATNTVVSTVTDAGETVYNTGKTVVNKSGEIAIDGWQATSQEALAFGHAIESAGLQLSDGVVSGANMAAGWAKEGSDYAYEGLVACGDYLNKQACDIALGSGLAAAFAALEADPVEKMAMGSVAAICAVQVLDNIALNTAASALAAILVEPIYRIPGVSKAGDKKLLTDVIAFVIFKCAKEDPRMVVGTAGQIFVGAIIAVITTLTCDGTLPGGFKVWQGAYKPIGK